MIDNMDPAFGTPFKLHYEGYKYDEIAESMDIPVGTVKSRIFQARKRLMHSLGNKKY
jgi:RNA polymerase sigma-70 factor (ECF subfamily)